MLDNFLFSENQDLTGVDSTGVTSTHYWDLEDDVTADQTVSGWLNVLFRAGNAGATEGLYVELRADNATNLASPSSVLAMFWLSDAELTAAAGQTISVGIKSGTPIVERYIGVWYRAHTTSLAGTATGVDAWISSVPEATRPIQTKPGAAIV